MNGSNNSSNGSSCLPNFNANSNASSTGTSSPLNIHNSNNSKLANTASVIVSTYNPVNSNGASHNSNSHNQTSLNLSNNSIGANTYSINGILGIDEKHKLHQPSKGRSKRKITYEGKFSFSRFYMFTECLHL